ncbi:MAG: amidohydrolase family protein [Polyangiales bacterium]
MISDTLSVLAIRHSPSSERRLHVHGAVLTQGQYLRDGTVIIQGSRVVGVEKRTPASDGAIDVETRSLLTPGFVDAHNHVAYGVFARWNPNKLMTSRFDWRGKSRCAVVNPSPSPEYGARIQRPFREIRDKLTNHCVRYGQLRGLIGGATTIVTDAEFSPFDRPEALAGFVRDHSEWSARIWGVLDVTCLTQPSPGERPLLDRIREDIEAQAQQGKAPPVVLVHCGEGSQPHDLLEFTMLDELGLLNDRAVLIHGLALGPTHWARVREARASVVWSPSSNLRLYGRTIAIEELRAPGSRVCLAPDWAPTGTSTMLDELAVVRERFAGKFSATELFGMVTAAPADILGLEGLGRLRANGVADILAFRCGDEPPQTLEQAAELVVSARPEQLELAMINGDAVYGTEALLARCGVDVQSAERISVASEGGAFERRLRLPGEDSAHGLAETIRAALAACKEGPVALAPLWEATDLR